MDNLVVSETDDETKDEISRETDHHDVLSANTVTEEGAKENTRKSNRSKKQLPFGSATDTVARGDDTGNNCSRENTVGEGDEVVEEPGTTSSDQGLPVVAKYKQIRNTLLDGTATVQFGVEHLETEIKNRQGQEDTDTKAYSPHSREVVFTSSRENDQEYGDSKRATE